MDDAFSFDLDAYAARYYGRTKMQRLRFIAERSPPLRQEALCLALKEAKKGRDTALYKEIYVQIDFPLEKEQQIDHAWIATNDAWAEKELSCLRRELDNSKQGRADKEVIRTGHNDLGDFFHKRGRLQQARGDYIKTRDYCMHAQHTLQMCIKVISVSIEAADYAHVENHYLMAENIPDVNKNSSDLSKMRACAGLALLVRGNYSQAATHFLGTNTEPSEDGIAALSKQFGDVMSLEDVATYGGLCALATMDRSSLAKQVIEKPQFRNLLELVPDIREMIHDFYHTRYTRCLDTMQRIRAELNLDMHLGKDEHVDVLYRLIRRKAIVQYVSPFVSADLRRMQAVFRTSMEQLETELLSLIECGSIHARIDTQNLSLHGKKTNRRLAAISSSLEKGQDAFDEAEAMLLRMTLLKNNVQICSNSSLTRGMSSLGPRGDT